MRSHLFNREFTFDPDGWIEVLRVGEYPHSSDIIQVVDSAALDAIVSRFNLEKQKTNFPGLLVDFDHFSADMSKPSEAAGWIKDLRRDGDALLALVDWSDAGEQAVRSGRYRLLSPVFDRSEMQDLGGERLRPVRLDSAGLTNAPNMKGLAPISNRSNEVSEQEAATLSPRAAGERFAAIVNRFKTENNCSHDVAWNQMCGNESVLFNRMAATPHSRISQAPDPKVTNRQQRDSAFATDRILALAKNRQQTRSIPFDRAWQEVCVTFPDLNAKAYGNVLNRAAEFDVSKADSQKANSRAEQIYSMLEDEANSGVDRGTFASEDALRGLFKRAIDRYMREEQMTRRAAFDHIKETEPVFWTRAMLNFDLEK